METLGRRLLAELRAAALEARLEELSILRSFSRPRVSDGNPYSKSLFMTVKCRPDDPRRPLTSNADAYIWIASFVEWCNHQRHHNGI
jgi:putative transposase